MESQILSEKPMAVNLPVRQEAVIKAGILSRATLHRLKKKGLPTHKIGGMVFIDLEQLRNFLNGKPVAGGK